MEQKQAANYDKLLLDITLSTAPKMLCNSTPSLLQNHQSEVSDKENSPTNNSHITKIEDYIIKKYNQTALRHLKSQTVKAIKHEFTNNDNNELNNKGSQKDASDMATELRAHIQTLESEVHFLREELKEKSVLLRSLIIDKQNANSCPKLPATPENSTSSTPITKKQVLTTNKNIDFHIDNGLKNKHISEVNKVKKVLITTDNNQIKVNKTEIQTIYANNDSSHTTTKSKENKSNINDDNTNSNNNSDNIQDTITPNP